MLAFKPTKIILYTVHSNLNALLIQELKVGVVGSEIVGLVPLKPLLMAADYYIEKEGLFVLHESQKVKLVINRLGLSSLSEFKPEEKIIEYGSIKISAYA